MIYFASDYSQGAHPKVLKALAKINAEHCEGYGLDRHCENAAKLIKKMIKKDDCGVHMMIGGTPCNITVIAASLKPYEAVVAARSGHIYAHETGAIEATGHRIIAVEGVDGKLTPDLIDRAFEEYEDEHTLLPKMVFISQPTEVGTIYGREELKALRTKCLERGMYLYIDGARLGSALTCEENDLTIEELANLCDAFYIGGTKNGALLGEALVILNSEINDHFRFMMKRQGGMLAKGMVIGAQFEALLEGGKKSVYFEAASHANGMAKILREGLISLGIEFYSPSPTNQVFPVLPKKVVEGLEKEFSFHKWAPERDGKIPVRFVTGWGTQKKEVEKLLSAIKKLYKK